MGILASINRFSTTFCATIYRMSLRNRWKLYGSPNNDNNITLKSQLMRTF